MVKEFLCYKVIENSYTVTRSVTAVTIVTIVTAKKIGATRILITPMIPIYYIILLLLCGTLAVHLAEENLS